MQDQLQVHFQMLLVVEEQLGPGDQYSVKRISRARTGNHTRLHECAVHRRRWAQVFNRLHRRIQEGWRSSYFNQLSWLEFC